MLMMLAASVADQFPVLAAEASWTLTCRHERPIAASVASFFRNLAVAGCSLGPDMWTRAKMVV